LTIPAGSAQAAVPSTSVQPFSRQTRRPTVIGAVQSVGVSGCWPGGA